MLRTLCVLVLVGAGCGSSIGDSCSLSTDCASDNSRSCDTSSPGGYCTIAGCDYGTCPGDATCARFFPGLATTIACAGPSECGIDEVCTLAGLCAPRSIERRYCMATCGGAGDCRDGYECRDEARMKAHGGEPVPDPDTQQITLTSFCAPLRPCMSDADCADTDTCDLTTEYCVLR
jgi:hypothetical protein